MKKGFIFILILVVLFVGAILIYDFSDIPSEMLAGHDWYLIENNDVYVLNLENNKFSFKNKNNDEERYKNCNTYKYNNSSNVIKLDCSIKNNKLYIATYDENKLVVTINGEEKNLSGLKFSQLDEDTQTELLKAELQVYRITDCTDQDIREIFRRQNAGKALSSKLVRVVYESDEFSDMVYSLANHPVMNKLMTKAQRKNGTDRDVIIQTIMLIASNQENQFTSFRAKDIDNFVSNYADQYLDIKDILAEAMDKLDTSYEEISIPATSIPQILYACYKIVKNKKSFSALTDKITEFVNTYDDNEEYKLFVQSGTTSQENVDGRFQYWRRIVKELQ